MGVLYSKLTRPIRTFNIANRAEAIISQKKPIPAPQYASTEKQKKLMDKVHPGFWEKHYQKNMQLDQRLKDVFITSIDPQVKPETESKLLPQNRYNISDLNLDYYEPAVIPEGKCTLNQALTFISQHKTDPIKYNSENIAVEHKIDKEVIDDVLKHFKIYVSIVPDAPDEPLSDPFQVILDQSYEKYQKAKKLKE
ncbi:protein NDUFAF4 homolog [Harpegnathos saltator]|uniref:protein NDUFAF4 homolog n=1 Tax=Harpegnathos saltator TaxID=610380 RepID=UPI0005914226|nr:protein NDUFAF4 homolog [Harpegnathos saltator]XP_019696791.1 protein NDUFAF4 homolog [Harpegnathos saltator]